jgi:hypothetical protein
VDKFFQYRNTTGSHGREIALVKGVLTSTAQY